MKRRHLDGFEKKFPALTDRERETLHLLLQGKSEKEVAAMMKISFSTVHTYTKRIYRVLKVRGRAELFLKILGSEK